MGSKHDEDELLFEASQSYREAMGRSGAEKPADSASQSEPGAASAPSAEPSPYDVSSFFQRVTFSYVSPLLQIGAKRELAFDDLPALAKRDASERIVKGLLHHWRQLQAETGHPTLLRAAARFYRKEIWWGVWYTLCESAFALIQPVLVFWFVQWLEGNTDYGNDYGWGIVIALATASFMQAITHHLLYFETMRLGWNMRIGMTGLVHHHLLQLKLSDIPKFGLGAVTNLISTDVLRFDQAATSMHFGWSAPIEVVVVCVLVITEVGWGAGFAGIGVVLLAMAVLTFFSKRFATRRRKTAAFTDERVKSTQEVLNGIGTVKAYTWEQAFGERINGLRKLEARSILKAQRMKAINSTIPLPFALGYANRFMESVPECFVALRRIEQFLAVGDNTAPVDMTASASPPQSAVPADEATETTDLSAAGTAFDFRDAKLGHGPSDNPTFVLEIGNLQVRASELVGIAGRVGEGKTTFLEGILGEVHCIAGSIHHCGHQLAYAGQSPWIFAGSLRDNILFDTPFEAARYASVLEACALVADIAALPNGEDTEIGEKGVNLSGGQKARVALARACYSQAPVVLLDDPLSAVDAHVAEHLFAQAIATFLQGRTVLLVTHHPHFVARCDRALLIEDHTVREVPVADFANVASTLTVTSGLLANIKASPPADPGTPSDDTSISSDEGEAGQSAAIATAKSTTNTAAGADKSKSPHQLVLAEDRKSGDVGSGTYWAYMKAGGLLLVLPSLMGFLFMQGGLMVSDWWLQRWAQQSAEDQDRDSNLHIYLGLSLGTTALALCNGMLFFSAINRANSSLHEQALARVIGCPMHFFTANPLGRIINRFASDLGQVDELLPIIVYDTLMLAAQAFGSIVVVCIALPWLIIGVPFVVWYLAHVRAYVTKSLRALKRLEGVTKSPVYAMFSANLAGLNYIRSFRAHEGCEERYLARLDETAACWFWWLLGNRYIGFRLDMLSTCVVTATAIVGILLRDTVDPGLLGLALVYAVALSGLFQFMVRLSAQVETYMTSVERILHYARHLTTESDEEAVAAQGRALPDVGPAWPDAGMLELHDLSVRYRDDLPDVLHSLSLTMEPGSKIGVMGRTGSGKSSLIQALLRLNVISKGSIIIDGLDTQNVPLSRLRQGFAFIPQTPDLFAGSVRFNLDPKGAFSEHECADVLKQAHLGNLTLDSQVDHQGQNLSTGQRQLLSLARAMLHRRRIVILDEASANIDYDTDELIQRYLRESDYFKGCTIIVIAHRLKTIEDADTIICLKGGHLERLEQHKSGSSQEPGVSQ
ncbi:uncharacterized protein MONBRDRAFT_34017 [Monosiga brevicollis MX1]|uniref:Uncharacterized protein n=1 Tax=Monosiga brevicollis TaxID=81824 RepID=A9V948_MONBE|nr:uncharacterized protein MONBRDRAFT_34017 [Monosiga brevicollis MX1]EDQ85993.1 predicted protein [Monosiga brevicollis MX1]|eukprot:XP_001749187.1 hypothetical protein [Monosiga brevicollis MX1]